MKIISSYFFSVLIILSLPAWGEELINEDKAEVVQLAQDVKEIKYVTDKLRLSLYKQADSSSATIKLLISGDILQVLEKSGPYSRVRTVEGEEGWVKNGFLVTTPTASYLLLEQQKQNDQLTKQLEKYSDTQKIVEDYENTLHKMKLDNESTVTEFEQTKQELDKINQTNSELKQQLNALQQSDNRISVKEVILLLQPYWYVVLGILIIFLIVGFILGKQMVQAQLRRRFQGVKIL